MEAGSQLKIDVLTKEMALNEETLIKDVDVQLEQTFNQILERANFCRQEKM